MSSSHVQIKIESAPAVAVHHEYQEDDGTPQQSSPPSRSKDPCLEQKPFLCSYCPTVCSNKRQLWKHLRRHTKPYECDICGKKFGSSGDCANHRRIHTGERPYECNLCDKRFTEKSGLRVHTRAHTGEKSYACEVCKMCFPTKGLLKSHLTPPPARDNDKNRTYPCTFCGKMFYNKRDCERHIGTHTGEKPHSCSVCGTSFLLNHHLKRHERSHHKPGDKHRVYINDMQRKVVKIKKGRGNYKCTYCGQKFTKDEYLNWHIRTHTGELPYACDECSDRFINPIALTRHRLVHTGERPFVCAKCGVSFKYKHVLQRHERNLRSCRPRIVHGNSGSL